MFLFFVDIHTLCRAPYMGGATPSILQSSRIPVTQASDWNSETQVWILAGSELHFFFFSGGFIYKYAGSSIVTGFNIQNTSPSCTVQGTFKCHFLWQTFNSERPFLLWRVNWHKMHYLYVCFVCISRPYSLSSRLIINFNRLNQTVTHDITLAC